MYEKIRKELDGEGEFPLLTRSQLRLLDEVKEVVDRIVNVQRRESSVTTAPLYMKYEVNQSAEILHVISDSEAHLMTIVQRLKSARKSKLRFVETYPKWKGKREDCILKLTEIADSINSIRFKCNVSKLIGYGTSVVAGGVALASAVLIPFSFGLTTPLAVGGTLAFAGAGTTIAASITETALLKSKVEQAKKMIDDDKEYFEDMGEWLNHAIELQEALQSVLGIDILRDFADSIKKFVQESVKIENDGERHNKIDPFITQILKNYMSKFTSRVIIPIIAIATFLKVLVTTFLLLMNTDNRVFFHFASLTIRSILGVPTFIDDSMNYTQFNSIDYCPGSAAVAKDFAKAVTRGAVAVVELVWDVIHIVSVSKDIHAGSLSPEADKIKDAVKKMREEVDVLARIYNNLEMYNNDNHV